MVGNRPGYDLVGSTVAAKVGIGQNRTRGYGLAVALSVSLPVLGPAVAAKPVDTATRYARTRTRHEATPT